MARTNRKLLFLKSTGALIGEISDNTQLEFMDLTKFDTLDIEIDEEAGEYFHGNYQSWEVRNSQEKPVVSERIVKYAANVKILNTYPIHKQLNVIIDVLRANQSIIKTDEFNAMIEFLDARRQEYQDKVTNFSDPNAFHYISSEEEEQILLAKRGVNLL